MYIHQRHSDSMTPPSAQLIQLPEGAITFRIGSNCVYTIEPWQLRHDGVARWLDHLSQKRWFTPLLELDFIRVASSICDTSGH